MGHYRKDFKVDKPEMESHRPSVEDFNIRMGSAIKGIEEFIYEVERSFPDIEITYAKVEYNPTHYPNGKLEVEYKPKSFKAFNATMEPKRKGIKNDCFEMEHYPKDHKVTNT